MLHYPHRSIAYLVKQGASHVVYHHKNSVSQALLDLFPDIGLDKSKLFECKYPSHLFLTSILLLMLNITS